PGTARPWAAGLPGTAVWGHGRSVAYLGPSALGLTPRDWLTLSVFTVDEVELDLDFPAAVSRLALLLRGDWLDSVSQAAYAQRLTGRGRVGPLGGARGASNRVGVSLLDPVPRNAMGVMR